MYRFSRLRSDEVGAAEEAPAAAEDSLREPLLQAEAGDADAEQPAASSA